MIVYDIVLKETFDNVERWLSELRQHADSSIQVNLHFLLVTFAHSFLQIMLVGNKADMRHVREVPTEKAESFCRDNGLIFVETSAKDNENVELAFERLITQIFEARTRKPTGLGGGGSAVRDTVPAQTQRIQLGQAQQKRDEPKQDDCQC